jgi:hypothetical protein
MFKKALVPALALVAASVAVPAAAQSHGHGYGHRYERSHPGRWQPIANRKYQMDNRIDVGVRTGALSRREANRLRTRLNSLVRLERNYSRNGLNWRERQRLDRDYDRLAREIRSERRDRDNRRW